MSKLKVLLLMLFVSLFFACKSAPKTDEPEKVEQEETVEQPAKEQSTAAETMPAATSEETASYTVYFAPRSYAIDSFTANKLDDIAEHLAEKKVKKIIIYGHSAKLNSQKDEQIIALQRATAAAKYFQEKNAFAAEDISIEEKGAREPDGRHSEITDRFKNRRVEIRSAE